MDNVRKRYFGTVSRGVRAPIIKEGDDVASIVARCVLEASESENIPIREKDIIAVTESVVGRAFGNYATVDQIASDIKEKFPDGSAAILFPILSRNRFSLCLKGIASGLKHLTIMLSYPSDEVGNHLISEEKVLKAGINPYTTVLTEEEYRNIFGYSTHSYTGVDYIDYYHNLVEECGCKCSIIFSNDPCAILDTETNIIACDIHTRFITEDKLLQGAEEKGVEIRLFDLTSVLMQSVDGSGYNEEYGLLGSNKATEDSVKLFPRREDCEKVISDIQDIIYNKTGKTVEVMVYGDGAYKDPIGGIWELADPEVSVANTEGLNSTPNELKLKYLADNKFAGLKGDALKDAISKEIKSKNQNESLVGKMISEGTTPRAFYNLVGSLCDLTSGSGDKGTPIVWIQGYFDNYTTE